MAHLWSFLIITPIVVLQLLTTPEAKSEVLHEQLATTTFDTCTGTAYTQGNHYFSYAAATLHVLPSTLARSSNSLSGHLLGNCEHLSKTAIENHPFYELSGYIG